MEVHNLLYLYDIFQGQKEGPLSKELLKHLQNWGVIAKAGLYKCRNDHVLKLCEASSSPDGWTWRCYKTFRPKHQKTKICGANISIRKGTFFEKSQLSIFQILAFSYLWVENTEINFIRNNVDISPGTAANYNKYCREICIYALEQKNININDEMQKNAFHLNPRKKFYRGAYEKFVFLRWCKLNQKNKFLEFMKYAGLLHNRLGTYSSSNR